jgi:hypothetical protein
MSVTTEPCVFCSSDHFDANRVGAAAIYCCDGRYGDHFDEFLHKGLNLPRYDRLALPGGAACLAGHFLAFKEEEALVEELRFLIKAHGLSRIVLIAHQDCGFYSGRLHLPAAQVENQQREDLQAAVRRIKSLSHELAIETFFARIHSDGTVRFEKLL